MGEMVLRYFGWVLNITNPNRSQNRFQSSHAGLEAKLARDQVDHGNEVIDIPISPGLEPDRLVGLGYLADHGLLLGVMGAIFSL